MGDLLLYLGGVRSGKSAAAEARALALGGARVVYLASGVPFDGEMQARIEVHRGRRPVTWRVIETPVHPAAALAGLADGVVLFDCVTIWIANLLMAAPRTGPGEAEGLAAEAARTLVAAIDRFPGTVVAVSNEVGAGVVPETRLGRDYRDALGRANQVLAAAAREAWLLVAGRPILLPPVDSHGSPPG